MKSRGNGGTPRQEPARTSTNEAPAPEPPARSVFDELRRWALRRAFVQQFKLIAERVIPALRPKRKKKGKTVEAVEHLTAEEITWPHFVNHNRTLPGPSNS